MIPIYKINYIIIKNSYKVLIIFIIEKENLQLLQSNNWTI